MGQRWREHWSEAIHWRRFVLRQVPYGGRGLVAVLAGVNLLLGVLPVVFVLATSVLIGRAPAAVTAGLGSPQWHALVSAFLVATAVFGLQQLLTPVQSAIAERMQHRVNGRFQRRLMEVSLRSTGIGALEDERIVDTLRQASETIEKTSLTAGHAVTGMLAYLARYTRLAGFSVIVAVVASPWAALAVLFSTLCFRYGQRGPALRIYMRLYSRFSPVRRERDYFRDLGMTATAAKEMRVYGLVDWAVDRFTAKAHEGLAPLWRERRRYMMWRFLYYTAIGLLVNCTVAALLVRSAAAGEVSLTHLALGLQSLIAVVLLGEYYHEADANTQYGMRAAEALHELEALVDGHGDTGRRDSGDGATASTAGLPRESIRFADVSFGYDGSARPVLDGLELTLRAGECTAIVGLNGAGKTTLVKLLTRLYEPTGGALLVDGRKVSDLPVDAWRRRTAVIFQDFNRYELPVTDNIALGAVERPVDVAAVRAAAAKSGMTGAIDGLAHGFGTVLSRQYDDGADLSGGQWQRVAIARALYAVDSGATVLVLDEPTAALDVRAEAEFFAEFAALTRGLTTVLISHRFSSVRHADRIVVLENGRVAEDGTHESLLGAGGRYAELFRLQAERFAAGLDAEGEPVRAEGAAR